MNSEFRISVFAMSPTFRVNLLLFQLTLNCDLYVCQKMSTIMNDLLLQVKIPNEYEIDYHF